MDPLEIIARIGTDNPPTDKQLADAYAEIQSALRAAATAETPDLKVGRDLRAALDTVKAEQTTRATAADEARKEAAALLEGLDEAEETPTEVPTDEVPVEVPAEPVAASAATTAGVIGRLRAYATERAPAPEHQAPSPGVTLRTVGPASSESIDAGATMLEVGEIFAARAKGVSSQGAHIPLVRLEFSYDEDRHLGNNVDLNNRRITKALGFSGQRPKTAAGGVCGPGDVDHSHPICSDRGRPIRDTAMPSFNAARGKLSYAPAASLGLLAGNVSIWTSATDSDPGTATKPCPPIDCPEEESASVDAVVRCLTVGNFQAQFSPEFWASRLELATAMHDREAEQKMISEIHAASTNLTDVAPAGGNVLANFLQTVNTVISGDRQVHRNTEGGYVVVTDAFVRDAIRNQFIQNNGTGNVLEAIQIADSEIDGWLSTVNARVVWTYDGTIDTDSDTHRVVTPGTMPSEATLYIYPEGAFLFLDGGTLDLGTAISDSSLNSTNDRQAFVETFEKVATRGCSAYRVEIALANACGCPA